MRASLTTPMVSVEAYLGHIFIITIILVPIFSSDCKFFKTCFRKMNGREMISRISLTTPTVSVEADPGHIFEITIILVSIFSR